MSIRSEAVAAVRANERATAEHEAAHAIVAEVLELPRDRRGILVTGGSGRCYIGQLPPGGYAPGASIAAFLAGSVFDDHRGRDTLSRSVQDVRAAQALADGDPALLSEGLKAAWIITQTHRPAIEHLAAAILRHDGRLVGADLDRALDAAMQAQPGPKRRNAAMNERAIRRRELFEALWPEREAAAMAAWKPGRPAPDLRATMALSWDEANRLSLHPDPQGGPHR